MPVGAGIGPAPGFSILDHIGEHIDLRVAFQQGIGQHVLFQQAEAAGEFNVLSRCQVLVGKDEKSVLGHGPREFFYGFWFCRNRKIKSPYPGAQGRRYFLN